MAVTRDDVLHVAALARLQLDEAALERLGHELNDILAYVDQLQQVDTEDVEPTAHPFAEAAPLREDAVRAGDWTETLLANAPERQDRFFVVPPVIE